MAESVYPKIFAYCERGEDPGFWAEPLNAVSNGAFLLAGLLALWMIARQRPEERSLYAWTLALVTIVIGIGSFLWHTFAERWAGAMDVIPIVIFMLIAVYGLCRRLLDWPIWAAWAGIGGYIALGAGAAALPCGGALCASKGYFPALIALGLGGGLLLRSTAPGKAAAGRCLLIAAGVFAVSLTLRSLDKGYCGWFDLGGLRIGAHYWWHIFNAVTLYYVIRAFWVDQRAKAAAGDAPQSAAPA